LGGHADRYSRENRQAASPADGRRTSRVPCFGLSCGWHYRAAALGEIKMVSVRQRNALRGVRLVVHDSVCEYIRRAADTADAGRSANQ
jgi:hypothetical protein